MRLFKILYFPCINSTEPNEEFFNYFFIKCYKISVQLFNTHLIDFSTIAITEATKNHHNEKLWSLQLLTYHIWKILLSNEWIKNRVIVHFFTAFYWKDKILDFSIIFLSLIQEVIVGRKLIWSHCERVHQDSIYFECISNSFEIYLSKQFHWWKSWTFQKTQPTSIDIF